MFRRTAVQATPLLVVAGILGVFRPASAQTSPAVPGPSPQPQYGVATFPITSDVETEAPARPARTMPTAATAAPPGGLLDRLLRGNAPATPAAPVSPPLPAKAALPPSPTWSRTETTAAYTPTRWTNLAPTPVVPAAYVTTGQALFEEDRIPPAADLGRPMPETPRHMVVGLPGLPVAVLLPPNPVTDAATVLWLPPAPGIGIGADAGKVDR
jgi:hypothetical protein